MVNFRGWEELFLSEGRAEWDGLAQESEMSGNLPLHISIFFQTSQQYNAAYVCRPSLFMGVSIPGCLVGFGGPDECQQIKSATAKTCR